MLLRPIGEEISLARYSPVAVVAAAACLPLLPVPLSPTFLPEIGIRDISRLRRRR